MKKTHEFYIQLITVVGIFLVLFLILVFLMNAAFKGYQKTDTNHPLEMETPMGHEMEYIRHIDEFLYEYKDTYTGIHYIVSVINGNGEIYRPVYQNEGMELVITK